MLYAVYGVKKDGITVHYVSRCRSHNGALTPHKNQRFKMSAEDAHERAMRLNQKHCKTGAEPDYQFFGTVRC